MKKIFGIAIAAVLIIWVFSYLSPFGKSRQDIPPEGPKKIRLVLLQGMEDVDLLVNYAQDRGFYAKHNIEVEKIYSDKDILNILAAGKADVLIGKAAGSLSAYYGGVETKLLANIFYPFTTFTLSRYSREDAGSIKKAAVVSKAPDALLGINYTLKKFGADPQKVEIVMIPSDAAREAMLSKGEIDFTYINSENLFNSLDAQKKYTVMEPSESFKETPLFRSIMTIEKALQEKPKELEGFVLANYEALEQMSNNRNEVLDYLRTKYNLSGDRAERFYGRFVLSREGLNYVPDADSLKDIAEFIKKDLKVKSNGRDIGGFIYPDFAKKAVSSSVK